MKTMIEIADGLASRGNAHAAKRTEAVDSRGSRPVLTCLRVS